jgi:MFS family permease
VLDPRSLWWRVVPAFAAGYFLSYGLRTVNAVIAPDLTREFSATAADLGLLTSAYFLAFGAFQLPLGVLLDRFGPRRVEASLLLFAGLGCALFGYARHIDELVLGRALIGLGVSACLMASFKAFSQWFPLDRLPSLTGKIMAAGGLGAVSSSLPVEAALPLIGWRGVFFAIAGLNAVVAVLLFFSVPDKAAEGHRESLIQQLKAVGGILVSRPYWRFAPQGTLHVGGFMAVQGLWAVPWMMTVNGLPRSEAANVIFLMALAMLGGFSFIALATARLARKDISPMHLLTGSLGLSLLVELLIVVDAAPAWLLWPLLGLTFSLSNLAYSQLSTRYPLHLLGRVNTTFNLIIFAGAFSLQWGIGAAIDGLSVAGFSKPEAFRLTFAALLVAKTLSFAWFLRPDQMPNRAPKK